MEIKSEEKKSTETKLEISNTIEKTDSKDVSENKNCCYIIQCFVDDKICCKLNCCNCCIFCNKITYSFMFLGRYYSLGIHVFDIGSDIFVLFDLYNKNLYFFFSCLSIIILSFVKFIHNIYFFVRRFYRRGQNFKQNSRKKQKRANFLYTYGDFSSRNF